MLLAHARARAHTSIVRSSAPETVYPKTADVPDDGFEDWEPLPFIPEPPVINEDCGCPQAATEEETDD